MLLCSMFPLGWETLLYHFNFFRTFIHFYTFLTFSDLEYFRAFIHFYTILTFSDLANSFWTKGIKGIRECTSFRQRGDHYESFNLFNVFDLGVFARFLLDRVKRGSFSYRSAQFPFVSPCFAHIAAIWRMFDWNIREIRTRILRVKKRLGDSVSNC